MQVVLNLTSKFPFDFYSFNDIAGTFNLSISCKDCGTKGTLTLTGHIEAKLFDVKVFDLSAVLKGVETDMHLSIAVSASDSDFVLRPSPIQFFVIPLGPGFAIPNIITLGPVFRVGAGLELSRLSGQATIDFPITSTIPDTSVANFNLAGSNRSASFSGWKPKISQGQLNVSDPVSANISIFGRTEVGFAIELLGQGIDIGIILKVPDFVLTSSIFWDSNDLCTNNTVSRGVIIGSTVGAKLSLTGSLIVGGFRENFLDITMFQLGALAPAAPQYCFDFGGTANSTARATFHTIAMTTSNTTARTTAHTTAHTTAVAEVNATMSRVTGLSYGIQSLAQLGPRP
jgi:hypothetical protein